MDLSFKYEAVWVAVSRVAIRKAMFFQVDCFSKRVCDEKSVEQICGQRFFYWVGSQWGWDSPMRPFKKFSNHSIGKMPLAAFDYQYDIACPNVIASAIQPIHRITRATAEQLAEDQNQSEGHALHQLFKASIVTGLDEVTA